MWIRSFCNASVVYKCQIHLKEILAHCTDTKALKKAQTVFVKATDCQSHTHILQLWYHLKIWIFQIQMPKKFSHFCKQAKYASPNPTTTEEYVVQILALYVQ